MMEHLIRIVDLNKQFIKDIDHDLKYFKFDQNLKLIILFVKNILNDCSPSSIQEIHDKSFYDEFKLKIESSINNFNSLKKYFTDMISYCKVKNINTKLMEYKLIITEKTYLYLLNLYQIMHMYDEAKL